MVRLIAVDLDGTLLNQNKELTPRNRQALLDAAARGILIVPATGRLAGIMPESVRSLPLRYVIAANGAQVVDLNTSETVYRAEIPCPRALEVIDTLDTLPALYDCYFDGSAWMERRFYERADRFVGDPHVLKMIRDFRQPVEDLKAVLRARNGSVQKLQLFFSSQAARDEWLPKVRVLLADLSVSSSIPINIELNSRDANKGAAVRALCKRLGIPPSDVAAFGDGLNDVSMIGSVGLGVAMENGADEVKRRAAIVAPSCDRDGVAVVVERLLAKAESLPGRN